MKAAVGRVKLQAKGSQGLPVAGRSQETGKERILPQSLQKEPTLLTTSVETSGLWNWRDYISVILNHQFYSNLFQQAQETETQMKSEIAELRKQIKDETRLLQN